MIFRFIKWIDVILGLGTPADLLENATRFMLQVEVTVLFPMDTAISRTAIAA